MNYEYLASVPQSVLTTSAFFFVAICFIGMFVSLVATIGYYIDGYYQESIAALCLLIVFGLASYGLQFWEKPVPKYETVTATLTESGFTREERTGKHSTATAGYLAYEIQDGSGMIYYHRIGNGSVSSTRIVLYKVAKDQK